MTFIAWNISERLPRLLRTYGLGGVDLGKSFENADIHPKSIIMPNDFMPDGVQSAQAT